jgi:serine/threonine protein phosphatase PrpC
MGGRAKATLYGTLPVKRYQYARASATSRATSQDAAQVFERDEFLVVVLADGGGGMRGGEAASDSLVAVVKARVDDRAFALEQLQPWIDLFHATDTAIAAKGPCDTTGVVVVLGPRGVFGVSAGDSEAWIVTPTRVDNLTVGQRTRERLGSNRVTATSFERVRLNGVLLIATDGLFRFASPDVIARIARAHPVAVAAERLVDLVRLRSGGVADDVAVVLVALC